MIKSPKSLRRMEETIELEAERAHGALGTTGGRPRRPILLIPNISNADSMDEHVHILCHWGGKYSQFEEELREWKKFLDYRQKEKTDGKTEIRLEERKPAENPIKVDLWKDYRNYQHLEVENTKQWVIF